MCFELTTRELDGTKTDEGSKYTLPSTIWYVEGFAADRMVPLDLWVAVACAMVLFVRFLVESCPSVVLSVKVD